MGIIRKLMAKAVSGSAPFRTMDGKMALLLAGRLSPARIVKYAMEVEVLINGAEHSPLALAAQKYIEDHPKIHPAVIQALVPYLNDPHCEMFEGLLFSRFNKIYHPVRYAARSWLLDIARWSPHLSGTISALLKEAPPYQFFINPTLFLS